MTRKGEIVQYVLRDLVLAVIAYQVMGWWGPVAIVATYIVGGFTNAYNSYSG